MSDKNPTVLRFTMTVPVLERLIGGDSQVEIELRKSIVHEFSRRHLAEVAKVLKYDIDNERKRIFNEVFHDVFTSTTWTARHLAAEPAKMVREAVQQALTHEIHKAIREELDAAVKKSTADLQSLVERALTQEVMSTVRERVHDEFAQVFARLSKV